MQSPMDTPAAEKESPGCLRATGRLSLLALLVLAVYLLLWAVGAVLIVSDPLKEASAIVVLSGGESERWEEAGKLYQDGIAKQIILTETDETVPGSNVPYSRLVENNISAMGVPKDHIYITHSISTSTYDESHSVLELMQGMDFKSAVVVTDPYHTLRTRLIFNHTFRGSGIKVSVHALQGYWYRSATWMFSLEGWKTTLLEIGKIGAYFLGIQGG